MCRANSIVLVVIRLNPVTDTGHYLLRLSLFFSIFFREGSHSFFVKLSAARAVAPPYSYYFSQPPFPPFLAPRLCTFDSVLPCGSSLNHQGSQKGCGKGGWHCVCLSYTPPALPHLLFGSCAIAPPPFSGPPYELGGKITPFNILTLC